MTVTTNATENELWSGLWLVLYGNQHLPFSLKLSELGGSMHHTRDTDEAAEKRMVCPTTWSQGGLARCLARACSNAPQAASFRGKLSLDWYGLFKGKCSIA